VSDLLEKLAERIDELENQLAFQDELYESLNATVARQDREILELKRHYKLVSERLKEIGDVAPGSQQQDETPPHY
jgi:SlyX protein